MHGLFSRTKNVHSKLLNLSFRNYFGNLPEWERILVEEQNTSFDEKRKKKIAMLMGYAGTGFKGSQYMSTQPYEASFVVTFLLCSDFLTYF